jgi:hypothetical protein
MNCRKWVEEIMKKLAFILLILASFSVQAAQSCKTKNFLNSPEGKEKVTALYDRSKGLILSKLEALGIEEDQVQIKSTFPKSLSDTSAGLEIELKSKTLKAEGMKVSLSKLIKDEDCGIEMAIDAGHLLNKESGKDFGSLGRVKEFIRLN